MITPLSQPIYSVSKASRTPASRNPLVCVAADDDDDNSIRTIPLDKYRNIGIMVRAYVLGSDLRRADECPHPAGLFPSMSCPQPAPSLPILVYQLHALQFFSSIRPPAFAAFLLYSLKYIQSAPEFFLPYEIDASLLTPLALATAGPH